MHFAHAKTKRIETTYVVPIATTVVVRAFRRHQANVKLILNAKIYTKQSLSLTVTIWHSGVFARSDELF